MSYEGAQKQFEKDNETAESGEVFDITTRVGIEGFQASLEQEASETGFLAPDLDIEVLDLPEQVKADVRKYRLEYKDLLRMIQTAVDSRLNEVPTELTEAISEQYELYKAADLQLSESYLASQPPEEVIAVGESLVRTEEEQKSEAKEEDEASIEAVAAQEYAAEVESELRAYLASQGISQIDRKLRNSLGFAETIADVDRIKNNILTSPDYKKQTVEGLGPVERTAIERLRQTITDEVKDIKALVENQITRVEQHAENQKNYDALNRMQVTLDRAEDISAKIDSADEQDQAVATTNLEKYATVVRELKSDVLYQAEVINRVIALEVDLKEESVAEPEESLIPENLPVRKLTPAEQNDVQSEVVPIEPDISPEVLEKTERAKRVSVAMGPVYRNLFLTKREVDTAEGFKRQIERFEKEGASVGIINSVVKSLESYAAHLVDQPSVESIPARAEKLVRYVAAADDAELVGNVQATHVQLDRLLAENATESTAESQAKVVEMFQNLESFARDNESKWLKLCGLSIPVAGAEGVFAARSMREGLMVMRDRHPALRSSLSKQLFVDGVIQELRSVPSSGLTQIQVDKITNIAKLIDVPERVVEAKQTAAAARAATPVFTPRATQTPKSQTAEQSVEKPETLNVVSTYGQVPEVESVQSTLSHWDTIKNDEELFPQLKRKKLAVEDLSPEQAVKITVAEKAEELIAEADEQEESQSAKTLVYPPEKGSMQEVVAQTESEDPVNRNSNAEKPKFTPNRLPTKEERDAATPELSKDSFVKKYLVEPTYASFIKQHYSSPEAFEKVLRQEIRTIDAQKEDRLSSWLGEKKASAFDLLEGMDVRALRAFNDQKHEDKKAFLREQNVSYESYTDWIDLLGAMQDQVDGAEDMQFGELTCKWLATVEMTYYQNGTSASQFTG